ERAAQQAGAAGRGRGGDRLRRRGCPAGAWLRSRRARLLPGRCRRAGQRRTDRRRHPRRQPQRPAQLCRGRRAPAPRRPVPVRHRLCRRRPRLGPGESGRPAQALPQGPDRGGPEPAAEL
ncbi:MAG: hypothetical protein AVDCRST_MAG31-2442, partial [uncultured Sphingomonas sp.]